MSGTEVPMPSQATIHVRADELRRLETLMNSAHAGRGDSVLICGEPGSGKTTLMLELAALATEPLVLKCTAIESETQMPFVGLYTLLRPLFDHLETLNEYQASVLRSAFALGTPVPALNYAVGAAALSLLSAAADMRPILCLVDDAQWLDPASAQSIQFASRRLDRDPIFLVASSRADDALDLGQRIELAPLDEAGAGRLLQQARLELPSHPVLSILVGATEGNPLALIESVKALTPDERQGTIPLRGDFRVAGRVTEIFETRLRSLSFESRRALLVAAVSLVKESRVVTRALGVAGPALDSLESSEVEGLISTSNGRLRFRHPLVQSAVISMSSEEDLRVAHRALAEALNGTHEFERAWHQAGAAEGPDEEVAAALEHAAHMMAVRGDPRGGATALARSVALTPDPDVGSRRLLQYAHMWLVAGGSIDRMLDDALADVKDPLTRLDFQIARGYEAAATGNTALLRHLADAEVDNALVLDSSRAAEIVAMRLVAAWCDVDYRGVDGDLDLLEQLLEGLSPSPERPPRLADVARAVVAGSHRGDPSHLVDLGSSLAASPALATPALLTLMMWDDSEVAIPTFEACVASARRSGDLASLGWILAIGGHAASHIEHRAEAEAYATEGLEACVTVGNAYAEWIARTALARLAAMRGDLEGAQAHLDHLERFRLTALPRSVLVERDCARAAVAAARNDHQMEAATWAEVWTASRHFPLARVSLYRAGPNLIESLLRLGRRDEATSVFVELESEAGGLPGSAPAFSVAIGRMQLAQDDQIETHYSEALRALADSPRRLDLARVNLLFGERLRRDGRRVAARTHLEEAEAIYTSLNYTTLAERARRELEASGIRRRRSEIMKREPLTPQERRVAMEVARGLRNRDVAASLYLSPKTVEMHIAAVFRKLGINSRAQLVKLVAERGPSGLDPE